MHRKANFGCVYEQSEWMMWLYPNLFVAFKQFKKVSVIFLARLLIELGLSFLFDPTSFYTINYKDPKDNRLLSKKLMHSWIQ